MRCRQSNGTKVLVVEDECMVRLDAAETLRDAGYEVVEAADADEALLALNLDRDREIELVFTDINMPGPMNGLELVWRIREQRPTVRLVLTSGAIRPLLSDLPDRGAFIAKPYSPESMTRAVDRMFA